MRNIALVKERRRRRNVRNFSNKQKQVNKQSPRNRQIKRSFIPFLKGITIPLQCQNKKWRKQQQQQQQQHAQLKKKRKKKNVSRANYLLCMSGQQQGERFATHSSLGRIPFRAAQCRALVFKNDLNRTEKRINCYPIEKQRKEEPSPTRSVLILDFAAGLMQSYLQEKDRERGWESTTSIGTPLYLDWVRSGRSFTPYIPTHWLFSIN